MYDTFVCSRAPQRIPDLKIETRQQLAHRLNDTTKPIDYRILDDALFEVESVLAVKHAAFVRSEIYLDHVQAARDDAMERHGDSSSPKVWSVSQNSPTQQSGGPGSAGDSDSSSGEFIHSINTAYLPTVLEDDQEDQDAAAIDEDDAPNTSFPTEADSSMLEGACVSYTEECRVESVIVTDSDVHNTTGDHATNAACSSTFSVAAVTSSLTVVGGDVSESDNQAKDDLGLEQCSSKQTEGAKSALEQLESHLAASTISNNEDRKSTHKPNDKQLSSQHQLQHELQQKLLQSQQLLSPNNSSSNNNNNSKSAPALPPRSAGSKRPPPAVLPHKPSLTQHGQYNSRLHHKGGSATSPSSQRARTGASAQHNTTISNLTTTPHSGAGFNVTKGSGVPNPYHTSYVPNLPTSAQDSDFQSSDADTTISNNYSDTSDAFPLRPTKKQIRRQEEFVRRNAQQNCEPDQQTQDLNIPRTKLTGGVSGTENTPNPEKDIKEFAELMYRKLDEAKRKRDHEERLNETLKMLSEADSSLNPNSSREAVLAAYVDPSAQDDEQHAVGTSVLDEHWSRIAQDTPKDSPMRSPGTIAAAVAAGAWVQQLGSQGHMGMTAAYQLQALYQHQHNIHQQHHGAGTLGSRRKSPHRRSPGTRSPDQRHHFPARHGAMGAYPPLLRDAITAGQAQHLSSSSNKRQPIPISHLPPASCTAHSTNNAASSSYLFADASTSSKAGAKVRSATAAASTNSSHNSANHPSLSSYPTSTAPPVPQATDGTPFDPKFYMPGLLPGSAGTQSSTSSRRGAVPLPTDRPVTTPHGTMQLSKTRRKPISSNVHISESSGIETSSGCSSGNSLVSAFGSIAPPEKVSTSWHGGSDDRRNNFNDATSIQSGSHRAGSQGKDKFRQSKQTTIPSSTGNTKQQPGSVSLATTLQAFTPTSNNRVRGATASGDAQCGGSLSTPVSMTQSASSALSNSTAFTLVYHMGDESTPYRSKFSGRREDLTLKRFKHVLSRKGRFKYYFKCDDPELNNTVWQEVTADDEQLPLHNGIVHGKVVIAAECSANESDSADTLT